VINECHTLGRRRKRMVLLAEVEPPPAALPAPDLGDGLSALPEKLRLPLLLHYLEGFALKDVAGILRVPLGTVKSRLHQARKELRLQLEEEDDGFHLRVEQRLGELRLITSPPHRVRGRMAVLIACAALLCGAALALERMGVLHFLNTRIWQGREAIQDNVAQPSSQSCDSELLDVELRDAYWDGERLSICLHVRPRGDYAFYMETDVGQDGESFDKIWWKGEILPLKEWLAGRQAIRLGLPGLLVNGEPVSCSWDWVQEEQGETLLVQGEADDLTKGAELALTLKSRIMGTDIAEKATLTATLPPMKKEERK
jgi:hypothetical protein